MIYIKGTKNPADALSRKPFWEPRTFQFKSNHIPIKKIPNKVMFLIVKALSGDLDWESYFEPTSNLYSFDRPNRFTNPVKSFSDWEFQLEAAMTRAAALHNFPQLTNG